MSNSAAKKELFQQDGEIDLQQIFRQLWVNKWWLVVIMLFTLMLGIFYVSRQIPQYQAEVLLQIKSDRMGGGIGVAGRLSQSLNFGSSQIDSEATQIALIKSRFILAPVVKNLGLDISVVPKQLKIMHMLFPSNYSMDVNQFEVSPKYINKNFLLMVDQKNHFSLYTKTKKLLLHGIIGHLATNKAKTIRLLVRSINAPPKTTFYLRKMSNAAIVRDLLRQLQITDLGAPKQNTGVLVLSLSNPKPEEAVQILNAIGKTIQAKDIEKNATEASKTLDFLYQQLPITKHDLETSESALNIYRAKNGKIDIKLQAEYLLKQLTEVDKQLGELRIDKIDKLRSYTVKHPFIIALKTKIRELNVEKVQLEEQLKKLPASDQIAVNLMRDVKVKSSLYVVLLNKIQELQVIKAGIVSDVRILSLAKLPYEALPQKSKTIYLSSLFLGFIIGCMIVFSRKLFFPRVDDPHWGERHLDIVNLAIVPYSKEQLSNSNPITGQSLKQVPLLAYVNPRNLAIESLRSLRTTLQVRLSLSINNIVAILGVSPGVGKSFVSANLAYLLSTAGKRVVVIDTDMRRGTLHNYFSLLPSPGLAEYLNKKNSLSESLRPTMYDNLMILPRGSYPDSPSELLSSESFKDLLTTLSQEYDVVIIDTPPVLLVTDAVLVGVHAGTNYLVLGAGAHQPKEIELSINRLTHAGVSLNGSIFNFHRQSLNIKSYYGYGYEYGYYYDDKERSK